MTGILGKLIKCCISKKNQKEISELIKNKKFHYVEPKYKTAVMDKMWEIGRTIRKSQYIEIHYEKSGVKECVKRKLSPWQ